MNFEENILAYLRGELSEANTRAFEAELQRNTALAAEVARQRQSWELLGDIAAYQQQKSEIANWLADADPAPVVPLRRNFPVRWLVGAAAAIALIVAFVFLFPSPQPSHEALLSTYYQPYEVGQLMGGSQGSDSIFDQGVQLYKQKKWPEVIQTLISFPSDHVKFVESRMLIGIGHMQQAQYSAAISFLEEINQDPDYGDQARWYQSLAHLMAGQEVKGRALLEKIKASQGYKHREASELLSNW